MMTNTTIDPKHECPACEGAGSWDVMTYLHWNGDSGWREERCERCEGHGWLYESEMTDEELAQMAEEVDNLQVVCYECHKKKSADEHRELAKLHPQIIWTYENDKLVSVREAKHGAR